MKKNLKLYLLIGLGILVFGTVYYLDSQNQNQATTTQSTFNIKKETNTPETPFSQQQQTQEPTINSADLTDIEAQQVAEQDFFKAMQDIQQKYPWYDQLPLETNEYLIVYDWDQKKFLISLKSTNTQSQNAALNALRKIGADPNKWGYYIVTQ